MDKYARNHEFEICPYDCAHRVEKGTRFQAHLIACSQNYPDTETVHCPFNYTHLVKKPELKYHLSRCPDGDQVKKKMLNLNSSERTFVPPVQAVTMDVTTEVSSTGSRNVVENWDDDDCAAPVLNLASTGSSNNHFVNFERLSGLKKAKKKQIRKNIARGRDAFMFEDDDNPPPQQPPNPPQPPKPILREIPLPRQQPETTKIGSHRRGIPTNRIAANIFAGLLPIDDPPQQLSTAVGLTVNPPPGIRPPPGLTPQSSGLGFIQPPFYQMPVFLPGFSDGLRMNNLGRGMINDRMSKDINNWPRDLDDKMASMSLGKKMKNEENERKFEDKELDDDEKVVDSNKEDEEKVEDNKEWTEQVSKRKKRLDKKVRQK